MKERVCSVRGCGTRSTTNDGLCAGHRRRLRIHGNVHAEIPIGGMIRRFHASKELIETVCVAYKSGESCPTIAKRLQLARQRVTLILKSVGVKLRDSSSAAATWLGKRTSQFRTRLTAHSHAALRGKKRTHGELCRRALGKMRTQSHATDGERYLADELRSRGFKVELQKAVDKYNLDLAIEPCQIAVEVYGGGFHSSGRAAKRFHTRTRFLMSLGWSVVIVWVDNRRYPLGVECAERITSLAKDTTSQKQLFKVLTGDGFDAPEKDSFLNTPHDMKLLGLA